MSIHTTVDVDSCLRKLRAAIAGCSPNGYAPPMTVALLYMTIRLIEQQAAELAMYRAQKQAMDAALIEATMPPKIVEAILHVQSVEMAE